jgi:hypothetical protein
LSDAAAKPEVPRRLTIATRESALAMWQAEHIRAQLAALYPASEVILLGMTTGGRSGPGPARSPMSVARGFSSRS